MPTVESPATFDATESVALPLTSQGVPVSISDDDPQAGTVTAELSVGQGILSAEQVGGATVSSNGTEPNNFLLLTGGLADVNAELATLTYAAGLRSTSATTSSDTISVSFSDSDNNSAGSDIAVTIGLGPVAVTAPATATVTQGIASSLGALSIGDANDQGLFTVTVAAQSGILGAAQAGAATVIGENSSLLTLTGTRADVNAELAGLTYVGAPLAGSSDTAQDQVTVLATDPSGAKDRQILDVTVGVAPYDHFSSASGVLAFDLANFAPQTQIAADALTLEAGAVSAAIGTLAGTTDQAAFDQSAAVVTEIGVSPPGSPAAQGSVEGLYDSLLAGAVGAVSTAGAVPLTFALEPILTEITDDAAVNQQHLPTDVGLLNLDIQFYYEDLSGGSSVAAPYQAFYEASLKNGQTLVSDSQAGATPAQLLGDISNLYDGLITGALTPPAPQALRSVQTALGTLKTDVGADVPAKTLGDVSAIYASLVTQAAAPTASDGAVQTFDAATSAANALGINLVNEASADQIQATARNLLLVDAPTILGIGENSGLGSLLDDYTTLQNDVAQGETNTQLASAGNSILSGIFGGSQTEMQTFDAFASTLSLPLNPTNTQVQDYSLQLAAEAMYIISQSSPTADKDLDQALTSLSQDSISGNVTALGFDINALSKGVYDQAASDPAPLLTQGDIKAILQSVANNLGGNPGNNPLASAVSTGLFFGGFINRAFIRVTAVYGLTNVVFTVVDYLIDHKLPLIRPHGNDPGNFRGQYDAFKSKLKSGVAHALGFGDVHLTTFTGQYYNLQAAGEFVLTKSTQPGNSFQVQARFQPWFNSAAVTVTTELAAEVGADRVTFDINRPDLVWVNGKATALSPTNGVLNLAGGQIVELSPTSFQLTWKTGESMTVTNAGSYLNYSIGLGPDDGPGSVKGLLGTDESQANDFTLPDGTILPQNLTSAQLYGTFANDWRVTQSSSLLDYALGQTTADFTNTSFPTSTISLAQLPADIVANAAHLAASAGITDSNLAAGAELDYIATGDTSFFGSAANAQQLDTITTAAPITPSGAPTPEVGVSGLQTSVTPAAGQSVSVAFEVYLTGTLTTATTIDYTLLANAPGDLGASAFGGTAPSGQVTIAAGQTTGTFSIEVPANVLGQTPTKALAVAITSPDGLPIFAATAATTLVNPTPEAGPATQPTISALSDIGTLTRSGTAYTLDLGPVVEGEAVPALKFAVNNTAGSLADQLAGTLGVSTASSGFAAAGTGTFAPIAGGASYDQLYVVADTNATGSNSQTITLIPEDVNASGYSATLPNITLTIIDTVVAPAQAVVNTLTAVDFGAVRQGSSVAQAVSVTNTAASGGAELDATSTANGGALGSGEISGLVAGATDASDLSIGIQTAVAGPTSGVVTLDEQSDAGDGNTDPLPNQTIDVSGTVYREAAGQITPAQAIVHVGDPGTEKLVITNTDPADGYSEGLRASLMSSSGAITASGGSTGLIAAGDSGSTSLMASFSTATAGTQTGGVGVDFETDGTGTSGLETLDLGTSTVPLSITVNNYAQASIEDVNGVGTFKQSGDADILDLGTLKQGAAAPTIDLGVLNSAVGPADLLSGSFAVSGDSAFANTGLDAFTGLTDGGTADTAPTVSLATGTAGTFSETITLTPTGSNASGYSGSLTPKTLTITGKVQGGVTAPALALSSIIANAVPVVSGTADAGDTVTLNDGKTVLGTTKADASTGAFNFTGLSALAAGEHDFTATATNGSGVTGAASNPLVVEVGTAATIVGELDALEAKAGLAAIVLTDTHVLTVASLAAEQHLITSDAAALAAIQGGYYFAVATTTPTSTSTSYYNSSGVLLTTSTTKSDGSTTSDTFAPSGALIREGVTYADKSQDIEKYGITGQSFTTEHNTDNSAGVLTSQIRKHADGTFASTYVLNTDGSSELDSYNATGILTRQGITHGDKSQDVTKYSGTNPDTVTEHDIINAQGAQTLVDQTQADGSHKEFIIGAGQTLTSNKGVSDIFNNTSAGSTSFVFNPAFGQDLISGFHAGIGSNHDTIHINNSALHQYSDLVALMSPSGAGGQDTLITIDPHDTILLKHVAISSLNAKDFSFSGSA